MKSKLLIIALIVIAHTGYTQISSGNLLIGGSAQFRSSDNADIQSITISPNIHYFINDNISFGGTLGYNTQRNNIGANDFVRTNTFSIGPEARYYMELGESLFFYGAGRIGLGFGGSNAITGNSNTDLNDLSTFSFNLNPGILFTPGSKIGFNFELNLFTYRRVSNTPAGSNTSAISNEIVLGPNTFTPTFGLFYIL
ncbi:outer membrane beta-barrel protein [Marivirga arenosa]|uniref:Outer membrane beta-barrel protein n=1 Tax=Marivirga arenosa TaxID=3059076 RepID=A0AA51N898_9BACT|nr:outer membrane beta-barrel protein [Marivirga sp. ABR2-2]WMN06346.1 outer membrane beta-barrel protein [Marivirga sp. ABR2-2]